jgi:surface protein
VEEIAPPAGYVSDEVTEKEKTVELSASRAGAYKAKEVALKDYVIDESNRYAYAVLDHAGVLSFFRSDLDYTAEENGGFGNGSGGSFEDSRGNVYTGTLYTGFGDHGFETRNTQAGDNMPPWYVDRESVKHVQIAQGQVIRPENSTSHWFYECRNLTDADLTRLDTASVTDMSFMFCHCEKLTALSQQFDTGKVTDMRSMFANARMLDILDLTGFHTAAVSSMNAMFYGGSRLQNIFVSDAWTTEAAADSAGMFYNCRNLPNFDASCTDRTRAHIGSDGYLSKEL